MHSNNTLFSAISTSFVDVTGSGSGDSVGNYSSFMEASYTIVDDTVVITKDVQSDENYSSESESSESTEQR